MFVVVDHVNIDDAFDDNDNRFNNDIGNESFHIDSRYEHDVDDDRSYDSFVINVYDMATT